MSLVLRYHIGLMAMSAVVLLSACARQNPDELVASARDRFERNDLQGVVVELKNALQIDPAHPKARLLLGKALLELEEPGLAAVELQKAREAGVDADEVLPLLAKAWVQAAEHQKVVELDSSASAVSARSRALVKLEVALAQSALGKAEQADAALAEALQADPDNPSAQLQKARLSARRGDADGALATLSKIVALDANNADAWALQGDLLQVARGDRAAATTAYRKALAIRPNHLGAHGGLLTLALDANDLEAARDRLDALKTVRPQHLQTRYFEARLAAQRGDLRAASDGLALLLKAVPSNQRVLLLAASVSLRLGEPYPAIRYLDRVLQQTPKSVIARRLLARAYMATAEPEQAYRTLEPLLNETPSDAQVLLLAGSASLLAGDRVRAAPLIARAAKLAPADAATRSILAVSRIGLGEEQAGLQQLEAIAGSDRGTHADLALVATLVARSDFDAALKAVGRLQEKTPGQALAPHLRGRIQLLKGDRIAARASFEQSLAADSKFMPSIEALARLDLQDQKPQDARRRLEAAVQASPDDARALSALAALDDREGKSAKEVAEMLARAVAARPTDPAARHRQIQFLMQKQDHKAALEAARAAVVVLPNDRQILAQLAATQLAAGEAQQAASSYSRLVTLKPRDATLWVGLAEAQFAMGSLASANESAEKALALAPRSTAAVETAVKIDVRNGNQDRALQRARQLQKAAPASPQGWIFEGDIELSRRNWTASAAAFRTALQKKDASLIAQRLHVALRSAGESSKSEAFAEDWLKTHPRDDGFLKFLASWAIVDQDLPRAARHLESALAISPDDAGTLNNLAWVNATLKRPGASVLAERARRLAPQQPQYLDTLALALSAEGKLDEAIKVQKQALELAPGAHGLRLNLARLYLEAGKKSDAREELDALARVGKAFPLHRQVTELQEKL